MKTGRHTIAKCNSQVILLHLTHFTKVPLRTQERNTFSGMCTNYDVIDLIYNMFIQKTNETLAR